MPRILIVDSHGVYRRGLRLALQMLLPGCQIIESDTLQTARKEFESAGLLDLVLIDVDSPDSPLDALRALHEDFPGTRIVAMSATTDREAILYSLQIGLFGFVAKSQSDEELFSAIKDILSGRIYVPSSLSQPDRPYRHVDTLGDQRSACPSLVHDVHAGNLTPRQREILPLLAKGMSNKEIARALKIAEGTTKIHASGLLRVLGVRNRTEAAVVARDYIQSDQSTIPREAQSYRRIEPRRR